MAIDWHSRLLALKAELEALDASSGDGRRAVDLDQTRVGRLSRMDALQGQAMNNAIAARRGQQLSKLDAALERLEAGEFGYCQQCGEEIAEQRLELDPTTPFCRDCLATRG